MNAPEAVISADSHLSETVECFLDIDPKALLHDNAAALYGL